MTKTKEFKVVAISQLEAHPDALAYPTDADDRAPLDCSLAEQGLIQPIIVTKGAGDRYLVLDGVGRVDAARKAGLTKVECKVVECEDPRSLALTANGAGRKRTTGSRILTYIMQHQANVIRAAACSSAIQRAKGGVGHGDAPPHGRIGVGSLDMQHVSRGQIPPTLTAWTSKAVAERLGVSRKDTDLAISLLVCQTDGADMRGRPLDDDARKGLDDIFGAVVCGRTPIRRWRAALAGKSVDPAKSGRAATDHGSVALRAVTGLATAFAGWQSISMEGRGLILDRLSAALDGAPDDVAHLLAARYARQEKAPAGRGKRS